MLDDLITSLETKRAAAITSAQTAGSKELREWYYGLAHGLLKAIDLCREQQRLGQMAENDQLRRDVETLEMNLRHPD